MNTVKKMKSIIKNERGFTLVELLIVVVILSILAAVIIPQLTGSTDDAKLSSLDTNLAAMRSSTEIYNIQHNNVYPGVIKSDTVSGTTLAHANADAAYLAQMSKYSDSLGNTSDVKSTTFKYGPYTKKGIPKNPLPNAATTTDANAKLVTVDTTTATLGTKTGSDATVFGWVFVQTTGETLANNTAYDDR